MKIMFEGTNTFDAANSAENLCGARGISVGQMQGPFPHGLLFSDYLISKWRGMNASERKALHGTMDGDMRNGPVTVTIKTAYIDRLIEAGERLLARKATHARPTKR